MTPEQILRALHERYRVVLNMDRRLWAPFHDVSLWRHYFTLTITPKRAASYEIWFLCRFEGFSLPDVLSAAAGLLDIPDETR